ncbi:3-hydroxydecanoyl-[ACP] dehydratase [Gilliamella apicola]|nr:hypothetical protein [Gilliamella apicola]KFA59517.1 3-hydroxydecanoyl-[ACP] dehydratase [Gilliamella apicola]
MRYSPANYYLPHESPMVMIEKVHLITDEQCICSVQVSKTSVLAPFLNRDYSLSNFYAIELMAQTIGVWNGYYGLMKNSKPVLGMLLGGRSIKTTLQNFPHNCRLMIHTNLVLNDARLANFDCNIMIDEQCVATGKLNVYEPTLSELDQLFGKTRLGEEE